jgi:hypothetical protein
LPRAGGRAPLDALWLRDPPCSQHAGSESEKCRAAETGLSLEMANKLNGVMPGSGITHVSNGMNTPSMAFALV